MANGSYSDFDQFRTEVLGNRAGPLVSPVEDMADEMYQLNVSSKFDSLWDSFDDIEE